MAKFIKIQDTDIMNKTLCYLGLHDWMTTNTLPAIRHCAHCQKMQRTHYNAANNEMEWVD